MLMSPQSIDPPCFAQVCACMYVRMCMLLRVFVCMSACASVCWWLLPTCCPLSGCRPRTLLACALTAEKAAPANAGLASMRRAASTCRPLMCSTGVGGCCASATSSTMSFKREKKKQMGVCLNQVMGNMHQGQEVNHHLLHRDLNMCVWNRHLLRHDLGICMLMWTCWVAVQVPFESYPHTSSFTHSELQRTRDGLLTPQASFSWELPNNNVIPAGHCRHAHWAIADMHTGPLQTCTQGYRLERLLHTVVKELLERVAS